ncbi:hypothetical protein Q8F55_000209 [Vanrija albida]|uniref:Spc7 kinetochore protein domain-containing protein n=1 Tax=Vanrija albida TaxID=181172 RepID=A0ABR3QCM2_9TREE
MGGESLRFSVGWENLSEGQRLRRSAQPRKSILKGSLTEESTEQFNFSISDAQAETIHFGDLPSRMDSSSSRGPRASLPATSASESLGAKRRVSFAPSAHVRMFEKKPARKSLGVPASFRPGPSAQSPSRRSARSSLSGQQGRQSLSNESVQQPPASLYFQGEGEGQGEESMELESDSEASDISADSDEILAQVTSNSMNSFAINDNANANDSEEDEDAEGEMDMEDTMVGGGIVQHEWDEDEDDDDDMELESEPATDNGDDEEKTMDFTVALGGPMPATAPQTALRSRASIGYSHADASAGAPILPGEGDYGLDYDGDEMEMEETAVYGGVYGGNDESISSGDDTGGNRDPDAVTGTFNYTVGDASAMELTTVGGGILRQATATYNLSTNIFAPTPAPPPIDDNTGDFLSAGSFAYPVLSPIKVPKSAAPSALKASTSNPFAPAPVEAATEPTFSQGLASSSSKSPAKSTRSRQSLGGASTPKRTPAKNAGGTPSFARPTTSSAQKSRDARGGSAGPSSTAPLSAQKQPQPPATAPQKRNIFGASPETPGASVPRPTGMATAASVAKKLDFTSAPASVSLSQSVPPSTSQASAPTPLRHPQTAPATPSSARKRPRTDSDDEDVVFPSAKKTVVPKPPSPVRNIFASAPAEETTPEDEGLQDEEGSTEDTSADFHTAHEQATANVFAEEVEEDVEEEGQEEEPEVERSPTPEPERPLPQYTGTPGRQSLGLPRRSMGTPVRHLKSPAEGIVVRESFGFGFTFPPPTPSPAIPEEDELAEPEEAAPIQLATFLEMVGAQFMDDLPAAPRRRRSSVGRGVLGRGDGGEREYAIHDFAEAHIEGILLNMFNWAIQKMRADIDAGKEELASTEAICDAENPAVVREYLSANDEDRQLFEFTLREFKANTQLRARSQWYDWKQSLMERIIPDFKEIVEEMKSDAARHAASKEVSDSLLPDLRARKAELEAELAKHRAQVAEIAACDPEELADLKAAVVEQNVEIERFRSELETKTAKNEELSTRLTELTSEAGQHNAALEVARSMCDQFMPSDVIRLEREWKSLQELHRFRVVRMGAQVELVFASELLLSVQSKDVKTAQLSLVSPSSNAATSGLLELTRSALAELMASHQIPSLSALVRAVGQLWTAARHVRGELDLLSIYYPATFKLDNGVLTCTAALMLPAASARARLRVELGPRTLIAWPEELKDVNVTANVVYGSVDPAGLVRIAQETVAKSLPHVPGVLLQACAEAAATLA